MLSGWMKSCSPIHLLPSRTTHSFHKLEFILSPQTLLRREFWKFQTLMKDTMHFTQVQLFIHRNKAKTINGLLVLACEASFSSYCLSCDFILIFLIVNLSLSSIYPSIHIPTHPPTYLFIHSTNILCVHDVPDPGLGMILVNTERSKGQTLSSRIQSLMKEEDMKKNNLNMTNTIIDV